LHILLLFSCIKRTWDSVKEGYCALSSNEKAVKSPTVPARRVQATTTTKYNIHRTQIHSQNSVNFTDVPQRNCVTIQVDRLKAFRHASSSTFDMMSESLQPQYLLNHFTVTFHCSGAPHAYERALRSVPFPYPSSSRRRGPRARMSESEPKWDSSRPISSGILKSLMLPKTAIVCEVRSEGSTWLKKIGALDSR